ncbi:MAG TPA: glycosyltransferase [Tepidisphaeraceae bacterium]|nr:glycosyltransferase [Tepidisphaeraceae bacterium]
MAENVVIQSVDRWLGRTETWLYEQVKRLARPFESHVVCASTENLDQFPWPNIHKTHDGDFVGKVFNRLGIRRGAQQISRLARRVGAGLIHSHFANVAWSDLPAVKRADLRHIATFYGYDVIFLPRQHPQWRDRYMELFDSVDHILCEGPHMAAQVQQLGCPREKLRVHHLGVAVDRIEYRPRSWTSGQPLRVLIAATFHQKKGIPFAIRALGELSRSVPVQITLIGDENNHSGVRSDKANILQAIEQCKLTSVTRLLGFQPHDVLLREAYSHHIYMAASITADNGDTEGGAPVSLIEMIATGMPVVATRHCDIPNVVIDRQSGLLADERDIDGLTQCLQWLVANPDQWAKLTQAGRQRVEREFDSRLQGQRLAAIYQEALAA